MTDFEEVVARENSPAIVREADSCSTVKESGVADSAPVKKCRHDDRVSRKPVGSVGKIDPFVSLIGVDQPVGSKACSELALLTLCESVRDIEISRP